MMMGNLHSVLRSREDCTEYYDGGGIVHNITITGVVEDPVQEKQQ